jgi:hypothetical protein
MRMRGGGDGGIDEEVFGAVLKCEGGNGVELLGAAEGGVYAGGVYGGV